MMASLLLDVVGLLGALVCSVQRIAPAAHTAADVEDLPVAYAHCAQVLQVAFLGSSSVGVAGRRLVLVLRAHPLLAGLDSI